MRPYHFFRPLLAPNQGWSAFSWQTHPACTTEHTQFSTLAATAAPLAQLFPIYLPGQPGWLGDGSYLATLTRLGDARGIPCLPASVIDDPAAIAACRSMRSRGAHVAIEVPDAETLHRLDLATVDQIVIDAALARQKIPLIDLINAYQQGYSLVARNVITHELFDWACAKRFVLTTSEFVSQTDPRQPVDADTTRLKLLKLLSLVVQDADTREIEEIFRQEPKLSYNLLRLVNSVAVGPKTPITGFNQAITVLGRRQLQRWLQLLIYANQFTQANQPNPLLQLAAARGRQMELLSAGRAADIDVADVGEAAFMVGIFSLLDTLLRMPMQDILASLPLAPSLSEALRERTGFFGRLLSTITAAESGDFDTAATLLDGIGISPTEHATAQVSAYSWACRINLE